MTVKFVDGGRAYVTRDGEIKKYRYRSVSNSRLFLINSFKLWLGLECPNYFEHKKGKQRYILYDMNDYMSADDIGIEYVLSQPHLKEKVMAHCYVMWIFDAYNFTEKNIFISSDMRRVVTFGESFSRPPAEVGIPPARNMKIVSLMGIIHPALCFPTIPRVKDMDGDDNTSKCGIVSAQVSIMAARRTYSDVCHLVVHVKSRISGTPVYL